MIQKPVLSRPATPVYHTAKSTLTAAKKCRNDTENIQTKASRRDAQPHNSLCVQGGLGMLPQQAKWTIPAVPRSSIFCMCVPLCIACQLCAEQNDWQAIFAEWAPTCIACQLCARQNNWQAGKRSFMRVVPHMPCLPGLCGGKRLAGRKTKFLHGVYHHALLARIVTAHFDCCQIRRF